MLYQCLKQKVILDSKLTLPWQQKSVEQYIKQHFRHLIFLISKGVYEHCF